MKFKKIWIWSALVLGAVAVVIGGRMFAGRGAAVVPAAFQSEEKLPGPLPRPEDIGIVLAPEPLQPAQEISSQTVPAPEVRQDSSENSQDLIRRLEEQGIVVY